MGYRRVNLSVWTLSVAMAVVSEGRALCQNPETPSPWECSRAAERLQSDALLEKAWGAHLAAACGILSLAAEIGAQLDRMHPETLARFLWDSEPFWVGHAMLDALIQLRVPLEAPILASIAQGYPAEATILMLRDRKANESLLADVRVAHAGGGEWVAAGNALAALRARGFAAALLREIRPANMIRVSDTDTGENIPPGAAGSSLSALATCRVPPGFPPVAMYRLTAERTAGAELVSDGPTPIYSQRTVIEPGANRTFTSGSSYCLQCLRVGYLAELPGISNDEAYRTIESHTGVRWSNPLQVSAAISHALAEQESRLRQLVKRLVSAGVLESSELSITMHVEPQIEDQRSDRSTTLPAYPAVQFQLR
jgi:hypothetical protein